MMVGDENAQVTVLHGAGGDKAAVLPTTEAGEGSFGRDTGAGQGTAQRLLQEGWRT